MYTIKLENTIVGETIFEFSDPPMGGVTGNIRLAVAGSFYNFLLEYVNLNNVHINFNDAEGECISTASIPALKIYRNDGIQIKGLGAYIEGIEAEGYQVTVFGIPYPFFENEFPHHVKKYERMS